MSTKASNETLYWYHGRITRDAAMRILHSQARNRDGCFLVRDCSSAPGDYVISIWANHQILHYQVHCNGDNRFSIDDGPVFTGLDTLVSHYLVKSDGLPCRLTTFCKGSLPPPQALKFGVDTPLHKACTNGNTSQVIKLLQEMYSNQEVNARNDQGSSPLHIASSLGHEEVVLLLLQYGADVRASSSSGTTALQVIKQEIMKRFTKRTVKLSHLDPPFQEAEHGPPNSPMFHILHINIMC